MNARFAFVPLIAAAASAAEPAITIYNNDFAVVRETVPLSLKSGANTAAFGGATAQLEPDSVVLRDPTGKTNLGIVEQSYRSEAVSQGVLLDLNEGKTIDFLVRDANGGERRVSGEIVRSGYVPGGNALAPIIKVDGKLRFELPGIPLFPDLADDTIMKPTLSWKLRSSQDAQVDAELSYVTAGFTWEASYNFVAPEEGDKLDMIGLVTIKNDSGATFRDATIKLIAGEVSHFVRARLTVARPDPNATLMARGMAGGASDLAQKEFDNFHLYTLPDKITLHEGEMKQVQFMTASQIDAKTIYTADGTMPGSGSSDEGISIGVAVSREFKNSDANHLGVPLPKGDARIYRKDSDDGRLEYVGEDNMEPTPKDETVHLNTGTAFDVTVYRKDLGDSWPNKTTHIQSVQYALHNHKKLPIKVKVVAYLDTPFPDAKISGNSLPYLIMGENVISFEVPVAAGGTERLGFVATYTVPPQPTLRDAR